MNYTVRELIIDAYIDTGLRYAPTEVTDEDTQIALRRLNTDIIDQLRLDQMWPSYTKSYNFQSKSGVWEYTIGVPFGGSVPDPDIIVIQEVVRIENAQVQIGNVWTPLRQISATDYYRQTIPEGSNVIPSQFMFNRVRDPYDRFVLSLGASGAYNMRISCGGVVANYQLDDTIDLPSGYYSALKFGLCQKLANLRGLPDTEMSMNRAYVECTDRIREVNAGQPPKLKLGGDGGLWSIGVDRVLYAGQGI